MQNTLIGDGERLGRSPPLEVEVTKRAMLHRWHTAEPVEDKVCDICGDGGYTADIATCCQCKKSSEHIYCMERQLDIVPEMWYCEGCSTSAHVVHDAKTLATYTKRKVVEMIDVKENKNPARKNATLNFRGSSEQIIGDEKQLIRTQDPLCTQHGSLKMLDTGNEKRVLVTGSPSGKHVMHPLSRNTSFKAAETAKVKFIPAEEVALLTSGAKARPSSRRGSMGTSSFRTERENIMPPPISQRTITNVDSITSGSKVFKVLSQSNEGHIGAEALSSSKSLITAGHVTADKEGDTQKDKASGKGASAALCKKPMEGSINGDVYLSSSKHIVPQESKVDYNSQPLHTDQRNRVTIKALGREALEAPIKEEPVEVYGNTEVYDSPSTCILPIDSKCSVDATILHTGDKKGKIGIYKFSEKSPPEKSHEKGALKVTPLKAHIPNKELALHNEIAVHLSPTGGSGTAYCSDTQSKKVGFPELGLPLTLLITSGEKSPSCFAPEAQWNGDGGSFSYHVHAADRKNDPDIYKGTFEVFDMASHLYNGIQAHLPRKMSQKAYDVSKQMPEKLTFKVLPRSDIWPQIFRLDPPTTDDIGLYFLPCELERYKENYISLLERIDSHDFAMQSCLGDVELLIFTSKQLPVDSQRLATRLYLWGVFRIVKRKNIRRRTQESFSSHSPAAATRKNTCGQPDALFESNSEEVDMEIDMVAGNYIGRIDKPIPRLDVPPGFSKPHVRDTDHGKRSLVKFDLKKPTSSMILDAPPGFSRLHAFVHQSGSSKATDKGTTSSRKATRGLVSSPPRGGFVPTKSEACGMSSKHHQVSNHDFKPWPVDFRSSYPEPSSKMKKGGESFVRSKYANDCDAPQTDMKVHTMSIKSTSLFPMEKGHSSPENPLHESFAQFGKVVLTSVSSGVQNDELVPKIAEGKEETERPIWRGVKKSKLTVPLKWASKEAEEKEKKESRRELYPGNKQLSSVCVSFDSPSSTTLSLFPEEAETIKDHAPELGQCVPSISSDLSLRRPQYVKDASGWISRERLKKDGCGKGLHLTL